MADLSNWLTKDNQQNIKNLATAGNVFSILGQGRMSNEPDTRFQQLAKLAAGGAAGSDLIKPAPTQPPPTEEAPVNVAPQQTKVQQMPATDANKNGVPDYLERTITTTDKTKIPYNGVGSKQYQPTAIPGATPGQSLPEILANFQGSTGGQTAGTPVASDINPAPSAPVTQAAPSVQNLNTVIGNKLAGSGISPDAQRLQNIGLLLGPQAMMDTWRHGAVQDNASANLMEAQIKAQQAPSVIAKNTADANKIAFEMSPGYVQRQGDIEYAKKIGDKQAELEARNVIIKQADAIPIVESRLKRYGTYGNLMRATGATDVTSAINAAIRAETTIDAAVIDAKAKMGAAGLTSDATVKSAMIGLMSENAKRLKDLSKREIPITLPPNPTKEQIALKDQQEEAFFNGDKIAGTQADIDERNQLKAIDAAARSRLGELGGINSNVYTSQAEVANALKSGKLKYGDTITFNGQPMTIQKKGK